MLKYIVSSTLLLLPLLSGVATAPAQTLEVESAFPGIDPPQIGLVPVPFPKLDHLEKAVTDQIRTFQRSFLELARKQETSNTDLVNGYGMLGQLYHAYEMFDSAELCYSNAIHLAPKEFTWHHLLAFLYEKTGRLPEAVRNYQSVKELRPDYTAASEHLGNLYLQLNQLEDARKEFETALSLAPDSPAAQNGLGQIALFEKDYPAAIRHFQTALKQGPGANRLHYSLAMAYRGMGNLEEAKSHLAQSGTVGIRPVDPLADGLSEMIQGEHIHMVNGQMAFRAGRYREAAALFAKAVEGQPRNPGAHVNLGVCLAKLENLRGAIDQFRSAIVHDPDNATAHFNLGVQLSKTQDYQKAIEHFETTLKIHPGDIESIHELAKAWIKIGQPDKALDRLLPARDLAADNEPVLLLASQLLISFGRYPEALRALSEANERTPERGLTAHALARFLAACPDPALRDGPRAVQLALRVFQAQRIAAHAETLALAFAESGRCDEAAEVQRELIRTHETSHIKDRLAEFRADLSRYEKGPPCRPAGLSTTQGER